MDEHGAERTPGRQITCPSCGTPADSGQLVCLECGARLALDYRRPFGWKLPLAIITVVLLLAGGGLAYALSEIDDEAEDEVAEAPAKKTTGKRRDRGAAPKRAKREQEAEKEPARRPKPRKRKPAAKRPAPRRPGPAPAGSWPAGRNGFTVVLLSTDERSSAVSVARDVSRRGTRAGYLRSNDFSSLQPGFWIVFSGVYKTRPQAERAVGRISRAFPGAFPQYVNGAEAKKRR